MNSNTNYVFRNRITPYIVLFKLSDIVGSAALYMWFFWGDWYGLIFFQTFVIVNSFFDILDNIRCQYIVQNGYLYITEYSWIFRKKEIEIPIRHITDVKMKKSLAYPFVYPGERVRIVVGKAKYDLKAVSCRVELYNCLTKMVKNYGNSNNC